MARGITRPRWMLLSSGSWNNSKRSVLIFEILRSFL
jgi:hypothetical protein